MGGTGEGARAEDELAAGGRERSGSVLRILFCFVYARVSSWMDVWIVIEMETVRGREYNRVVGVLA